ncbi:MAG: hypothetical protein LRY73_09520 [Bacillus sp. (in: Bacteria)]|nr:hypothetical protein [Bacillus sp. (in: firmicutes)]
MGHLDEQLKHLSHLHRDEESKMKTYHQVKAKLYERERPPRKSLGKIIGIPVAVMAALFIGFLISYQWFGDHLFAPAPADNQEETLIDGIIEKIYLGMGESADTFALANLETSRGYVETDNRELINELKETLNGEKQVVEMEPFIGLEVKVLLDSGEEIPLKMMTEVVAGNPTTYVYVFGEPIVYQFQGDLTAPLLAFLLEENAPENTFEIHEDISSALAVFPSTNVVTPGENPLGLSPTEIWSDVSSGLEGVLRIYYANEEEERQLSFRAVIDDGPHIVEEAREGGWATVEYNGREYEVAKDGVRDIIEWWDAGIRYYLMSEQLSFDELLLITDIMYGLETPTGEDADSNNEVASTPVEKYNVFADFELYHSNFSSGLSFLENPLWDVFIGWGHQSHAMGLYELFQVNETGDEVRKIRRLNEENWSHYEIAMELQESENWDELVELIMEQGDVMEELFFRYDESVQEEEISLDGQNYMVYPVEGVDRTHYFKEGEGLWMILYSSESIVEGFGEPQQATRIIN